MLLGQTRAPKVINPLTDIFEWFTAAWASDPSWTPPESNGLEQIATWPGHGTDGADFIAPAPASAGRVRYQESWPSLNNRPAVEFNGNFATSDAPLATFGSSLSGTYSIVMIGAQNVTTLGYWCCNGSQTRTILSGDPTNWRFFVRSNVSSNIPVTINSQLLVGVAVPGGPHSKLYVSGVTNTELATFSSLDSLVLGCNYTGSADLNGALAFVGVYNGDILTDPAWPSFEAWVADYYGVAIS